MKNLKSIWTNIFLSSGPKKNSAPSAYKTEVISDAGRKKFVRGRKKFARGRNKFGPRRLKFSWGLTKFSKNAQRPWGTTGGFASLRPRHVMERKAKTKSGAEANVKPLSHADRSADFSGSRGDQISYFRGSTG